MADEPQITLTEPPPSVPAENQLHQPRPEGAISPVKKSTSKIAWIILVIITILLIAGGGIAYFAYSSQSNNQDNTTSQPTPASQSSQSAQTAPTPTPTVIAGGTNFTSTALGISFNYAASSEGQAIAVKEVGNRIYVHAMDMPYDSGQFVEVITKSPSDSLEQAIIHTVLKDYDLTNCHVQVDSAPRDQQSIYQTAGIQWDQSNIDMATIIDTSLCPADYMAANGVRYFAMDPNHPAKLLFIEIGQYGIKASTDPDNNQLWQSTIRLTN